MDCKDSRRCGWPTPFGLSCGGVRPCLSHHGQKAHALEVLALDIQVSLSSRKSSDPQAVKPRSYDAIERYFGSTEELVDHISEGIANYYDPSCHEQLATDIQHAFPALASLQSPEDMEDREFATTTYSPRSSYANVCDLSQEEGRRGHTAKSLHLVNLNLSLA